MPGSEPLSSTDSTAIRNLVVKEVRLVLQADWDELADQYSEDAVLMPPNESPVQGRDAIRAWFSRWPRIANLNIGPVEYKGNGDLAYLASDFSVKIENPERPNSETEEGKLVWILRRQADGSWLKVRDIRNSSFHAANN